MADMKELPLFTVSIRNYAHNVFEAGSGTPMLFVHGSVADLRTFSASISRLHTSFRCIAYSRRFHPPNTPPAPGEEYDTAAQAEEMLEIIDAIQARPVIMVGSSFGAYIGLIAAIKAPGYFRALVLCEPPIVPLLLHHRDGKALHDDFVRNVMERAHSQFQEGHDTEALKTFVEGIRGQPGWFDHLFPAIRRDLLRFTEELRCEFLSEYGRYMVEVRLETLRAIRIPTLLLGGKLSKPMFGAILDVLADSIPSAERREIPRAGHLLHLQNAGAFETAVKGFVQRYLA